MSIVSLLALIGLVACGQQNSRSSDDGDGGSSSSSSDEGDEGPCPGVSEGDRTKVVAQVGETEITVCDVTEALNKMSPYLRKAYEAPEKRRKFVDNLIRFELIAQEAERRGFLDDEEVQRVQKQMMIQRLNKELQESVSLADITEEQMREYYESHQGEYHKAEMVRIARILCASEAECARVLTLAKAKATDSRYFRQLAREHSTDETTKEHGGDMPYFPRAEDRQEGDPEVDEAIAAVAFDLDMRDPLYSKVLKTSDGFNVVRLRGRRKARDLAYDDVKRQIRHRLHREHLKQAREELVSKLRKGAEIEIFEESLSKVRIEAPTPSGPAKGPAPEGKAPEGAAAAAPAKSGAAAAPAKAGAGAGAAAPAQE